MINLKNKLCIFDCDGTLVDTEPLIAKSWRIFFDKYYDIKVTEKEYFDFCHGNSPEAMCNYFNKKFGANIEFKGEMREKKRAITTELIENELEAIPSIVKFLEKVKDFRKCIASNSSKKKILLSIKKVGLNNYFNENEIFSRDLVSDGTIENSKPAPDMYIYTAKKMGYEPNQCIVFEDSITGIQACKSAGMTAIGCITPSCKDKIKMRKKMEENNADYIVEDMMDILKFVE